MFDNLIRSALTLLVGFALQWFFALIGFDVDESVFNALVGAIVVYFMTLFGFDVGARGFRAFMRRG